MILNPHNLPKIRSKALTRSAIDLPCTLRLASFVGMRCSGPDTHVLCHLPTIGKGTGTKVSDLLAVVGCALCHDLLDKRDPRTWAILNEYPHAYYDRLMRAHHETLGQWVAAGLVVVPGADVVSV